MSTYYIAGLPYSDELWHHGIKGQRWGVRRFTNPDGTLTEEGKRRYGSVENYERYLANRQQSKERIRENRRNASAQRGLKLLDKNRSIAGEIGRGVGKQIGISLGVKLGASAIAALTIKGIMDKKVLDISDLGKTGAAGLGIAALSAMGVVGSAHGIYKTTKNVIDLKRAKDAGYVQKKYR